MVVPVKQVPDLVEELELNPDGTDIDREFLKFLSNEWDDQALEEALLIKEATGGEVVVVGMEPDPDLDQTLYTALAKGADRDVKLTGVGEAPLSSHTRAAVLSEWLRGESFDLVLTGVQAPDDLDGQLPGLLGARLGLPHVSVAVGAESSGDAVTVNQEFSAGMSARLEVRLPAVLGVQAARQAPRYASITRIRQAMQAGGVEEVPASPPTEQPALTVRRVYKPERRAGAEMLTGSTEEVAERIAELLRSRGLGRG
jgi:electron transfer flavoprotein beta subunit